MLIVKKMLSILLCTVLTGSIILLLGAGFIQGQLFGHALYRDVIASPAYLPLVTNSITSDLERQGRIVDIPPEVLEEGIDETLIYMRMMEHVDNLVEFLNFRSEYKNSVYPQDLFSEPLLEYIEEFAAENNLNVNEEQIDVLADVAQDSTETVEAHINLFDLTRFQDVPAFQKAHRTLFNLGSKLRLAVLTLFLSVVGLVLLEFRHWRKWLMHLAISVWLAGSVIMIPSLVLLSFNLHRRLALETPYLQYAVSNLLDAAIRFFIVWGCGFFLASTIGLLVLFFTHPNTGKKRKIKT